MPCDPMMIDLLQSSTRSLKVAHEVFSRSQLLLESGIDCESLEIPVSVGCVGPTDFASIRRKLPACVDLDIH